MIIAFDGLYIVITHAHLKHFQFLKAYITYIRDCITTPPIINKATQQFKSDCFH